MSAPPGLPDLLAAVSGRLGGALAIVTGRPIAEVDSVLAPLRLTAAGIHGAQLRAAPGADVQLCAEPVSSSIVEAVRSVAAGEPGVIVELKSVSIAVHYRLAPTAEDRVEAALLRILDAGAGHLILCRGRKVFEIVQRHVSKGTALAALMTLPAFAGRRPVMIGDDVSDLSAFEAASRLGGDGFKVAGEQFNPLTADFAGAWEVRACLEELAARS